MRHAPQCVRITSHCKLQPAVVTQRVATVTVNGKDELLASGDFAVLGEDFGEDLGDFGEDLGDLRSDGFDAGGGVPGSETDFSVPFCR